MQVNYLWIYIVLTIFAEFCHFQNPFEMSKRLYERNNIELEFLSITEYFFDFCHRITIARANVFEYASKWKCIFPFDENS